jgi:hypothetical protein
MYLDEEVKAGGTDSAKAMNAKMSIVYVRQHDVAAVQPHRLGESIWQSVMRHNARCKNTKGLNPSKSGVHAIPDSMSYTVTRGFRPGHRFAAEQFTQ